MTKIVYNACYGGFGLSYAAMMRYAELKGIKLYGFVLLMAADRGMIPVDPKKADDEWCIYYRTSEDPGAENALFDDDDIDRVDPALVQVVEEMGDKANGYCAMLEIKELPAGTQYRIDEYDGAESVATIDSYEWKTA